MKDDVPHIGDVITGDFKPKQWICIETQQALDPAAPGDSIASELYPVEFGNAILKFDLLFYGNGRLVQ